MVRHSIVSSRLFEIVRELRDCPESFDFTRTRDAADSYQFLTADSDTKFIS